MRIENVLFDLDGTLVDSVPGIEYSAMAAVSAVIPQREELSLRRLIGPPVREVLRQALNCDEPGTLDELERRFRVSYDSEGWQKTVAYDGVAEVLFWLSRANVKSFVITNKPIIPTRKILGALGFAGYFEEVVSLNSREPPFLSKAEAAGYLITKHGLKTETTIFVGDSIDDARAAKLCDLRFAAAAYGYGRPHTQYELPVHIVLPEPDKLVSVVTEHNHV